VVLIALTLVLEGWRAIPDLVGGVWDPDTGRFGVLPMLGGSAGVALGAVLVAFPLGLGVALFQTEVAPPWLAAPLSQVVEALAGIPSVVYGFVGMMLFFRTFALGPGALASALVLAVMILPTIAGVAEEALRAVPAAYREGAAALGATPWQAVRRVVLPAARSGLVTAVALALGRALGETMVVLMVAGSTALLPRSPLSMVRTFTGTIAMEMAYATGRHREALFAIGALLLGAVLAMGALARRMSR